MSQGRCSLWIWKDAKGTGPCRSPACRDRRGGPGQQGAPQCSGPGWLLRPPSSLSDPAPVGILCTWLLPVPKANAQVRPCVLTQQSRSQNQTTAFGALCSGVPRRGPPSARCPTRVGTSISTRPAPALPTQCQPLGTVNLAFSSFSCLGLSTKLGTLAS